MAIFTFTDATGDIEWKVTAATICFCLILVFVFYNLMVAIYFCLKGRVALKAITLKVQEERKLSLERKEQDVVARQEKRKRKEHRDWLKIENERKAKLIAKREEMRKNGCPEEDINAKLPMEPVPKTGFQFGAVMGKRLIDYGIMSSSTDSNAEDETVILTKNNMSEGGKTLEMRRRESKLLPTNETQLNEEDDDERLETRLDTRLNTEEPL